MGNPTPTEGKVCGRCGKVHRPFTEADKQKIVDELADEVAAYIDNQVLERIRNEVRTTNR